MEGESVTVEVSNDVGLGVEGASIWRGAVELDGSTDSEGILSFIAPSVFMEREYIFMQLKKDITLQKQQLQYEIKATVKSNSKLNL